MASTLIAQLKWMPEFILNKASKNAAMNTIQ